MTDETMPRTLAAKLNYLFRTVRIRDERTDQLREFTNEEVAAATEVSATYVGYLRKGTRDNPTKQHMQSLAKHFGVPAAYLADDDLSVETVADIEAQLGLVQAMADAGVREIAPRLVGLSARTLDALRLIIEQARDVEQLPPVAKERARRGRTRPTGEKPAASDSSQ
jgi:transcriptional regulator with XRE-family HTH domain